MEPYGIIFLTENLVTGDTYIGQTSRKNRRDYYLGSGLHLRRAIKKYGRSNFEKQVLCECDSQEQLDRRERLYITLLCPVYNIDLGGRGRGKTSEETRIKLRLAKLGTKHTPEYRAALSAKTKGRILTEEHKRKLQALAESKKGKPLSLEARARMSAAKKGKPSSQKNREAISAALKGRVFSEEHRANLSAACKEREKRKAERRATSTSL